MELLAVPERFSFKPLPLPNPPPPREQGVGDWEEAAFCHLLMRAAKEEPEKAKGDFHLTEHLGHYGHCYKHFLTTYVMGISYHGPPCLGGDLGSHRSSYSWAVSEGLGYTAFLVFTIWIHVLYLPGDYIYVCVCVSYFLIASIFHAYYPKNWIVQRYLRRETNFLLSTQK